MSTLAEIRAAIVGVVAAVPNVGKVHDRERYVRENRAFQAMYVSDWQEPAKLLGWWLRRTATAEHDINIARTVNVHTWQLRGYMALNDDAGSELVFDDLIEAIRAAVRADPTFGGVCMAGPLKTGDSTNGVQVVDAGPVTFCGVLCHSAVLQLQTWSYL